MQSLCWMWLWGEITFPIHEMKVDGRNLDEGHDHGFNEGSFTWLVKLIGQFVKVQVVN